MQPSPYKQDNIKIGITG